MLRIIITVLALCLSHTAFANQFDANSLIGKGENTLDRADQVLLKLQSSIHPEPKYLPKLLIENAKGEKILLKTFKGQVLVMNFWASWNAASQIEMPQLAALQEALHDQDIPITILPVSEDFKSLEFLQSFYETHKLDTLEIYRDDKKAVFDALYIPSLPTTLIIDASGREVARIVGEVDWTVPGVKEFLMGFVKSE